MFHLNKPLVEVAQNMFGEPMETLDIACWSFPLSHTEISQPAEAKAAGEVNMQCLRVPVRCVPRLSPSSKVSNNCN